jgi:hypothetical protein
MKSVGIPVLELLLETRPTTSSSASAPTYSSSSIESPSSPPESILITNEHVLARIL